MDTLLLLILASMLASWFMVRRRARRGAPVVSAPLLVDDLAPTAPVRFESTATYVWNFDRAAQTRP